MLVKAEGTCHARGAAETILGSGFGKPDGRRGCERRISYVGVSARCHDNQFVNEIVDPCDTSFCRVVTSGIKTGEERCRPKNQRWM